MDRNLLDADEGNIRYRTDKPTDQRSSQNRSRTAHQEGTLPAIDIQGSISSARNGRRRSAVGKAYASSIARFDRCRTDSGLSVPPDDRRCGPQAHGLEWVINGR